LPIVPAINCSLQSRRCHCEMSFKCNSMGSTSIQRWSSQLTGFGSRKHRENPCVRGISGATIHGTLGWRLHAIELKSAACMCHRRLKSTYLLLPIIAELQSSWSNCSTDQVARNCESGSFQDERRCHTKTTHYCWPANLCRNHNATLCTCQQPRALVHCGSASSSFARCSTGETSSKTSSSDMMRTPLPLLKDS
jgi:hypothetical protein